MQSSSVGSCGSTAFASGLIELIESHHELTDNCMPFDFQTKPFSETNATVLQAATASNNTYQFKLHYREAGKMTLAYIWKKQSNNYKLPGQSVILQHS